jgi:hypothetical protein
MLKAKVKYSTPVLRKIASIAMTSERTSETTPIGARINPNIRAMRLPQARNTQHTAILKTNTLGNA